MKLKEKLQNILNAIALNLKSWKTLKQSATSLRNKLAGSFKGKTEKSKKNNEYEIKSHKDNEALNDTEIRDQNTWKPKYWRLFYPLDYIGFRYLDWYCWRLYIVHAMYDNDEETIKVIDIDYNGNREGFIEFSKQKWTAWDFYYKRFSIYHYVSWFCYEGNADRARKHLSNKCKILNIAVFLRTIIFKYFKYRGIISESNVEWIRTD